MLGTWIQSTRLLQVFISFHLLDRLNANMFCPFGIELASLRHTSATFPQVMSSQVGTEIGDGCLNRAVTTPMSQVRTPLLFRPNDPDTPPENCARTLTHLEGGSHFFVPLLCRCDRLVARTLKPSFPLSSRNRHNSQPLPLRTFVHRNIPNALRLVGILVVTMTRTPPHTLI